MCVVCDFFVAGTFNNMALLLYAVRTADKIVWIPAVGIAVKRPYHDFAVIWNTENGWWLVNGECMVVMESHGLANLWTIDKNRARLRRQMAPIKGDDHLRGIFANKECARRVLFICWCAKLIIWRITMGIRCFSWRRTLVFTSWRTGSKLRFEMCFVFNEIR